jgi:hypothetical protein
VLLFSLYFVSARRLCLASPDVRTALGGGDGLVRIFLSGSHYPGSQQVIGQTSSYAFKRRNSCRSPQSWVKVVVVIYYIWPCDVRNARLSLMESCVGWYDKRKKHAPLMGGRILTCLTIARLVENAPPAFGSTDFADRMGQAKRILEIAYTQYSLRRCDCYVSICYPRSD